ncbi:MAG: 1-(5-phosphoribosyl)-5-((5-phosphoribosylamino)methylideneamino)imidazole-4-carboxamide isomerase [Firmicutes bacterium]|nr:1-(5-phosphoribosyl)-5-((5-phosphoribosylamino)methylideneamino)imidazole-4-carboxamide isomerase [Alicyclobacillaceae bacterium]MCL6496588.1 1-(5-phosphoribosyl)-5-((5-phosphoribosylamino)methylideneamino)imidazole-4-carboxamide isomerase [Bacillota bacterium]
MEGGRLAIEIWPAIDVLGGEAVRLRQGHFSAVTHYASPLALAERLIQAGIFRVHLVDLDGARHGRFGLWTILEELLALGLRVEVGGGFRRTDEVAKALDAGAERVVVSSRLVTDSAFGAELLRRFGPHRVVAGIDVGSDGRVRVQGWAVTGPDALTLWQTLYAQGFRVVNVTDITRDGSLDGIRESFWIPWAKMPGAVGAGGGIRSAQDLKTLARLGLAHAVVGKAWLEGTVALADLAQAGTA